MNRNAIENLEEKKIPKRINVVSKEFRMPVLMEIPRIELGFNICMERKPVHANTDYRFANCYLFLDGIVTKIYKDFFYIRNGNNVEECIPFRDIQIGVLDIVSISH